MGNRILKESVCYSTDIDGISAHAERTFYRIIVRADDFGRLDARPNFLKSMLFTTNDEITAQDVTKAIAELTTAGLIKSYAVDGKPFLCLPRWHLHQRVRDSKAKYPEPPSEIYARGDLPQLAASCGEMPLARAGMHAQRSLTNNPESLTNNSESSLPSHEAPPAEVAEAEPDFSFSENSKSPPRSESVPFKQIMDSYNEICPRLRKIQSIEGERRKAVMARFKTYGLEGLKRLFEGANASDFLSGDNDRNWSADFDWLVNAANAAKVLEGKYSNRASPPQSNPEAQIGAASEEELEEPPEPQPKPPPVKPPEAWKRAIESIRAKISERNFDTWFRPVLCEGVTDGVLKLKVPSEAFRGALFENFKDALLEATGTKELKIEVGK